MPKNIIPDGILGKESGEGVKCCRRSQYPECKMITDSERIEILHEPS
jgi:hypothetical protein